MKISTKYTDLTGSHHVKEKTFFLTFGNTYTNTWINVEAIGEAW